LEIKWPTTSLMTSFLAVLGRIQDGPCFWSYRNIHNCTTSILDGFRPGTSSLIGDP
jgi:hypothetical protein